MSAAVAKSIANVNPFCESRDHMKKLEDDLICEDAMRAPLHEIERMMREQGRELMRSR